MLGLSHMQRWSKGAGKRKRRFQEERVVHKLRELLGGG